tara:strand:- start:1285 stop:1881 length:597 start_codon:yes stop_codon:yes gene_type:complete
MKKIKSFDTFLSGKKVDLIILDKRVVKNTDWYTWLNYKKNTELLETGKFPNTIEKQFKYLKNEIISKKKLLSNSKTDQKIQLGILDKKTNLLVGMVSAYNFNYFSRTCYVSLIIDLRKNLKNRLEIFKESQDLIIEHIFFKMNFRKIYSSAYSEPLSVLTEKLWGFKREGVLKEHAFVDGKYVDCYLVGLFRNDWKRI